MAKRARISVDAGIYRTPIELTARADAIKLDLVSRYGRIQALKIVELIYKDVKAMQNESDKKTLKKERNERISSLTKQFRELQNGIKILEEI